MKRRAGFTLLELLVVIGLIGMLMALLLPAIIKVKDQGKQKRVEVNERAIISAIDGYKSRYHKWPADDGDLKNGNDVYYGNNTDKYYHNQDEKSDHERIFGWGGNNKIIFDKLVNPPDGHANYPHHVEGNSNIDDAFIDLSKFIVSESSGNVLTKVVEAGENEAQFRITFDLDGNYLPSGGVAVDGVYLPSEGADVKDYYGIPE